MTSRPLAGLRVTVNSMLPVSPVEDASATESAGSGSSSLIVPVAVALVTPACIARERVTVKVSVSSFSVSPVTGTLKVICVSPGAKVRVPLVWS